MAKLTSRARNAMPTKDFGLSKERKFPMPDKAHAANAKARAAQAQNAGRMTPAQHAKINAKANHILDN